MKINFALIGLGAAQSGDGRESDYDYPYASEDRWEFNNGVTFTEFTGKTTGQQNQDDFVMAMKLSCWNSNMIRDMNNDNKFQLYAKGASAVQEANQNGWNYAKGSLTTGMNHQFGFEPHGPSESGAAVQPSSRMDVLDADYAQRVPGSTTDFHKWGYQTDGVNRAASEGYAANTVVYHFGHGDNKDNSANRPFSYDNTGADEFPADAPIFKDDWRYSLRMGGCLYEATEWVYDDQSFNTVGRLTYTGDRQFAASGEIFQNNDYTSAGSMFADVHWVHVFNAHIFPARATGYITGSATGNDGIQSSSAVTEAGAAETATIEKTARSIEDFNVVMANPTYEGHGFLNFVATYHDHVDIKAGRTGFGYAGYRFRSTIGGYSQYDNHLATECIELRGLRTGSTLAGQVDRAGDARCGSAIYENFGDWFLRPAQTYERTAGEIEYWGYIMKNGFDATADSLWSNEAADYRDNTGTKEEAMRGFAISSFPHNELGQDFRFNIRTLHNMGGGVSNTAAASGTTTETNPADVIWSYYFYAVDSIKIAFPEYVARVNHCHFKTHKNNPECQAAAFATGHDGWQQIIIDGTTMKETTAPSATSDTRFVDQKTQYGFTHNLGRDSWNAVLEMTDGDSSFGTDININSGYCETTAKSASDIDYSTGLSTLPEDNKPRKPCASWCLDAVGAGRGICGRILKIDGLLQTYDELHLRQFGTIQEVWVQLMYAYVETLNEPAPITTTSTQAVESPFPNVFFSAPEVFGLVASCPNGANGNYKCRGYRTYENQPYGGSETYNQRVFKNNNGATSPGAGDNDYHSDSLWASNDITAAFTRK